MRRRTANKTRRTQRGVGLIEVLVAVLVLAIGILGIAAMQTRALAGNGNALGRSMATIATYSIIDAMLVDRTHARAGDYNGAVTANACPSTGTLAQTQLSTWCDSLGTDLGKAATTKGTVDCQTTGRCSVTIEWDDSSTADTAGGGVQTMTTITKVPKL